MNLKRVRDDVSTITWPKRNTQRITIIKREI